MKFTALPLPGAFLIDREPALDDRGSFSVAFSREEFAARELPVDWDRCASSRNAARGTLRGLHLQLPPAQEARLLFCARGEVFDVMVDLREGSATFGRWWATTLREEDHRMVFIPPGFAHGYQSLVDEAELFYLMTAPYRPDLARGIRWDYPTLAIPWPLPPAAISERDRALPWLPGVP